MMTPEKPYRVYVDGIWDLFHSGHIIFMEKAVNKAKTFAGNREVQLIVGVCHDGVEEYKRKTIMNLEERCTAIKAHWLVHHVIANCPIRLDTPFLEKNQIDLVVHGDDFDEEKKMKYYGDAIQTNRYATVPYTKGVSTTQLIKSVKLYGLIDKFAVKSTLIDTDELIKRIMNRSLV